jgi:serine/threonine-protein kinase
MGRRRRVALFAAGVLGAGALAVSALVVFSGSGADHPPRTSGSTTLPTGRRAGGSTTTDVTGTTSTTAVHGVIPPPSSTLVNPATPPTSTSTSTSTSTPPVTVPSVASDTTAQACDILQQTSLVCGSQTTEESATVPAGEVVATQPPAGTAVPRRTTVDLVVSGGHTVAPDVVGLDYPTAAGVIANAGLTPEGAASCDAAHPKVTSQIPAPETPVPAHSAVSFDCAG